VLQGHELSGSRLQLTDLALALASNRRTSDSLALASASAAALDCRSASISLSADASATSLARAHSVALDSAAANSCCREASCADMAVRGAPATPRRYGGGGGGGGGGGRGGGVVLRRVYLLLQRSLGRSLFLQLTLHPGSLKLHLCSKAFQLSLRSQRSRFLH
jgi:hypothetical protein